MKVLKGFATKLCPAMLLICYMIFIMNIYIVGNGSDDLSRLSRQEEINILPDLENLISLSDEPYIKGSKITTPVNAANKPTSDESDAAIVFEEPKVQVSVTISAAGDCTLGRDDRYPYEYSFDSEFDVHDRDYSYFFSNVSEILKSDDFTIVNLEGTLTSATERANTEYAFKGMPEYINILTEGSIEAVTLANDQSGGYLQEGYEETINTVIDAGLKLCGEGFYSTYDANGIKIGIMGALAWTDSQETKDKIQRNIQGLKNEGATLIIAYFHWGTEFSYDITAEQSTIARYAIDCGADLVLGSHPHVIQPIELYNGKRIVYSLGNFCYGGSKNPVDKDSFIYQQTFTFEDGELLLDDKIKIIPISISSDENRNNYQPTPVIDAEFDRIKDKIISMCKPFYANNDAEAALLKAFD